MGQTINIGGGLPVRYNGDTPDVRNIAPVVQAAVSKYFKKTPKIQAEPGRYIVGDSAMTISSVIHIKEESGVSRAVVDTSVFGGHVEIIENGTGFAYPTQTNADGIKKTYRIGGCSCAGTDVMNANVTLPRLRVDYKNPAQSSRVFFLNTGAYTIDYIGTQNGCGFNGAKTPNVYFMREGKLLE